MITTLKQATEVQQRRTAAGKKGIAKAVKRFHKARADGDELRTYSRHKK